MKAEHVTNFILFALSFVYLVAELIFNARMLDVAGISNSTYEQVEDIQYFGRTVSASGFTLLVLGLFSKTGYLLKTGKNWLLAIGTALFCLLPLFMTFGGIIFSTFSDTALSDTAIDDEMHWSFVTLLGCYLLFSKQGMRRSTVLLGLIVMAWSSMFFGQKLLVERYVVSPTTWQERLNARYMLMARHYADQCIIQLGDLGMCEEKDKDPNLRSLNAVLANFLAYSNKEVAQDIHKQKEDIILRMIEDDEDGHVDTAYMGYLKKIDALDQEMQKKLKAVHEMYDEKKGVYKVQVYNEYAMASRFYFKTLKTKTKAMNRLSKRIWKKLDRKREEGWKSYQREASNYNTSIDNVSRDIIKKLDDIHYTAKACGTLKCEEDKRREYNDLFKRYPVYMRILETECGGNILEYQCLLTREDIETYIHKEKDPEFIEKSKGYKPNIPNREAFLSHPKTRAIWDKAVRDGFDKEMKKQGFTGEYRLPVLNKYADLHGYLMDKVHTQADERWRAQTEPAMGVYIAPGLSIDDFFKQLQEKGHPMKEELEKKPEIEVPEIPVMSRKQFIQKHVWPRYEGKLQEYFQEIEGEAPDYANRKQMSKQGKDYVRAVFIPPIALGLSLVISLLTLGKNIIFLLSYAGRYLWKQEEWTGKTSAVYYSVAWGIFFAAFFYFVSICHNPYTDKETYQRYHRAVSERSAAMAVVLDAIIRVQPTIYTPGAWLEKTFDKTSEKK